MLNKQQIEEVLKRDKTSRLLSGDRSLSWYRDNGGYWIIETDNVVGESIILFEIENFDIAFSALTKYDQTVIVYLYMRIRIDVLSDDDSSSCTISPKDLENP